MTLLFYPHTDDMQKGSLDDRIEVLMDAAERYKAFILDESTKSGDTIRSTPRDIAVAYNWEEIAKVLQSIRELPEANKVDKNRKGQLLLKLSEVYEVLRAAKMSKLEAVRLALVNEANQLQR